MSVGWREVCLICGIPHHTPNKFYEDLSTATDDILKKLPKYLPPSFLTPSGELVDAGRTTARIKSAAKICRGVILNQGTFFEQSVLIGHFYKSYRFDVPWRLSRILATKTSDATPSKSQPTLPHATPTQLTRQILSGRGVQLRERSEGLGLDASGNACGDFDFTDDDDGAFSSLADDPDDLLHTDTHHRINHLIHPPESIRGFDNSEVAMFKTSASPFSYVNSYAEYDPLVGHEYPWEGFGNFWLTKGCYEYLKAWVSLPSQSVRSEGALVPLTFEEELYEVINSQKHGRKSGLGTLLDMNYDGIDLQPPFTHAPWHIQIHAPIRTAYVLATKGDDSELAKAMLRDSNYWAYCPPDIWPSKTESLHLLYNNHTIPTSIPLRVLTAHNCPILLLPSDTLTTILTHLHSVQDYISLALTCTLFYNTLIKNTRTMNWVFRDMANASGGCLRWIKPTWWDLDEISRRRRRMNSDSGEDFESIVRVLREWCPDEDQGDNKDEDALRVMKAVKSPSFDWISFVKACYASDSMQNRRRLWVQVKQIEKMWIEYRLNGLKVDRFITKDQGIRAKTS